MTNRLVFVNNQCVQKIGGDAVQDITTAIEVLEPQEAEGIDHQRITLVNGVVTIRPQNQNEIDADDVRTVHSLVAAKVGKVLFLHENRIRVLEGKQLITRAQFMNALRQL